MAEKEVDLSLSVSIRENKHESYCCRVCGLEQDFQPWGDDGNTPAFEICGCCGVDFGYQDCTPKCVRKFRQEWLQKGGIWVNPAERPINWTLEEQMKNIPEEYR